MRIRRLSRSLLATLGAATLLATGAAGLAAQTATPPAEPLDVPGYPVSIHAGTCAAPVAQPIGPTLDTEVAGFDGGERVGISAEAPVQVASGTVDQTLDDLTGAPHVVAVHASANEYGTIVACGEIAGYVDDGRLVLALRSVDGSGVSGVVILDHKPSFLDEVLSQFDLDFSSGELSVTVLVIPDDEDGGA